MIPPTDLSGCIIYRLERDPRPVFLLVRSTNHFETRVAPLLFNGFTSSHIIQLNMLTFLTLKANKINFILNLFMYIFLSTFTSNLIENMFTHRFLWIPRNKSLISKLQLTIAIFVFFPKNNYHISFSEEILICGII